MVALRASNLLLADTTGTILLALFLVLLIGGVVGLWFVARVAPKGTVLAIAAGFFVLSFLIPTGTDRLMQGLVGFARMFGVIGGILGLVDVVKKRKPTQRDLGPVDAEVVAPAPQRPPTQRPSTQPPPTPPAKTAPAPTAPAPTAQQIECPKCQKKFKYRNELAGKTVKCPCGASFTVPGLSRASS